MSRAIIEFPDSIVVPGRRGRSFYALQAAPAADFGYEGDGAVDVLTGAVYVRADGAWSETGQNFFAGALAAAGTATTKAGEALADRELAQAAASTATTKAGEALSDRELAQAAAQTATGAAAEALSDRELAQAAAQTAIDKAAEAVVPLLLVLHEPGGIVAASYTITDASPGIATYNRLTAKRRSGTGSIVFRITVDGVPVTSAITVTDTLVVLTGLGLEIADGQEVAVAVESAAATATGLSVQLDGGGA